MRKLTTLCLTIFVLLESTGMSWGADIRKGYDALKRKDYATALREWTPLAEQGNATAQLNLCLMYNELYTNERGVLQDHKTAMRWCRLATDQGSARAAMVLEIFFERLGALDDTTLGQPEYIAQSETNPPKHSTLPQAIETPRQVAKVQPQIPQFPEGPVRPDDIAVIIANSDYQKLGKDIPNVKPANNDANGIKRYFTEALGVREGNIIFEKDATRARLMSVFGSRDDHRGKLYNWVKPNVSKVYVYYAGHGAPAGDRGTTYLVPSDTDSETVQLTGYPLKQLYSNLGKIPAKSITVILEACFSGQSQSGYLSKRTSGIIVKPRIPKVPSNMTVISAGAANQVASWEKNDSQSLFTKYFLKGMSGEGDKEPYGDEDGKVSLKELKKYLDGTMTYYARRYYGRTQQAQIVVSGRELSVGN